MENELPPSKPIVFFDGVCGLCNGFVDVLMRLDERKALNYATLQGETAKERLQEEHTQAMRSIVLLDENGQHTRSTAALRILMHLGGLWKLTGVFFIFPRFLRDAFYDLVARNRYKWFGKRDVCRIPTSEERTRFLP